MFVSFCLLRSRRRYVVSALFLRQGHAYIRYVVFALFFDGVCCLAVDWTQ